MTRAPANLLAVRRLLITHLGPDATPPAGVSILDPLGDPAWEVGIVGDADHRGGYHCGADRVDDDDYSVDESHRDRAGLTLDAAALDVGKFRVRTGRGQFDLPHYSRWLVAQCQAGTADTRHIREVIYSPDGRTVRRWDRLRRRSTGDRSHLGHTHESYFRDAIKAGADLTAVKRRYLTTIGLITPTPPAPTEDPEMELTDKVDLFTQYPDVKYVSPSTTVENVLASTNYYVLQTRNRVLAELADAKARDTAILQAVTGADHDAVLAAVQAQGEQTRAQLAAQAAADAHRDQDLATLLRAGQSGHLNLDALLTRLAEIITAGTTTDPQG